MPSASASFGLQEVCSQPEVPRSCLPYTQGLGEYLDGLKRSSNVDLGFCRRKLDT